MWVETVADWDRSTRVAAAAAAWPLAQADRSKAVAAAAGMCCTLRKSFDQVYDFLSTSLLCYPSFSPALVIFLDLSFDLGEDIPECLLSSCH